MMAGWLLIDHRQDMWVNVIRSKYHCGRDFIPTIIPSISGSNFWRGVCKAWKDVEQHLSWRLAT